MKHIVKVDRTTSSFRIVIPRNIILARRWGDVKYILVEDQHDDILILRRFIDGPTLEAEN